MKRILLAGVAALFISNVAFGQAVLNPYPPGPRLIDGSQLNLMVNQVNGLTGNGTSGTIKANSITAGDASLDITGLAAAQGGVVAVVGGASSTSGNAGGAFNGAGGLGGATGIGGAVTFTGGAGGSTSGTGGAVTLRGGAGTAGNAIGGVARVIGGAGQGSAAGGLASLTGGAGGATGIGGAIAITSGAGGSTSGAAGEVAITAATATSANGASVTITAGAGAGSTNAGGNVNLVPGAAVSTGIPGVVQFNGSAALTCPTYYFTGTPAATDQVFFIATRSYYVISASEIHSAAAGGASALQVVKDTGTDAPGAGTDLLTNNTNTGFDLSATANTVQTGTLTATVATKTLAAGNRLSVDFANAIQSSAGVAVTVCMAPI